MVKRFLEMPSRLMFCSEFGDTTDIESRSMTVSSQGASYEEILELKNGCLCCSIKDHGVMAIQNLVSSLCGLKDANSADR
jgi:G3E family GTPase